LAAGRGIRAGADGVPKQYRLVRGRPVLLHSVEILAGHPAIHFLQVVIDPSDRAHYERSLGPYSERLLAPVSGGADRQASVSAGLEALAAFAPDRVLIHDAARPFVSSEVVDRVLAALDTRPGAIPAIPLADTLKREGADRSIAATIERTGLWRAQTPQGFHFGPILQAHRQAAVADRRDFTDDAAVAEWAGLDVTLVAGSEANHKLTTVEDFLATDHSQSRLPDIRTGSGIDVHRFGPGDHVMLGGVRVPHSQGVEAHSDGDVVLHALTDALLGALADGDIGTHFPPSDPKWKGASSSIFLQEAARLVASRGGRIGNVDVTVLCELPRIGPQREAMRERIGAILSIDPGRVSVKATTTEKLGFTGRAEGLAATATATVLFPPSTQSSGGMA
jgi:2-C-methyl-D-erythritol 4-phosphate cytidylyltransferase / 2-C-methyl-D-erythritol 2,4-cyclodiphosphate synthase